MKHSDDPDFIVMDDISQPMKKRPWPEWRLYVTMITLSVGTAQLCHKFDPVLLGFVVFTGLILVHGYILNFRGYKG